MSSGKAVSPCPECNGTNLVIDLGVAMEHWIPTAGKSFLTNQVWRSKVFYEFDIVFCKDCGLTRHYNFDTPKDTHSTPSNPTAVNETSNSTSFLHLHRTKLIIIALILLSIYLWYVTQFFILGSND